MAEKNEKKVDGGLIISAGHLLAAGEWRTESGDKREEDSQWDWCWDVQSEHRTGRQRHNAAAFTGGLTLSCCRWTKVLCMWNHKKTGDTWKFLTSTLTPTPTDTQLTTHRLVFLLKEASKNRIHTLLKMKWITLQCGHMYDDCVVISNLFFVRYDKWSKTCPM